MRTRRKIILASLILALLVWVGNAAFEFLFSSGRALEELFPSDPRAQKVFLRIYATSSLVVAGLVLAKALAWREEPGEALKRQKQEIGLLRRAGHEFGRALDVERVYQAMQELVSQIMDCDALFVSSYDDRDDLIRCASAWFDGQPLEPGRFAPIPPDAHAHDGRGTVIQTGETLLLGDLQERTSACIARHWVDDLAELSERSDTGGMRSALIVPLRLEQKVVGAIEVLSRRKDAYAQADVRILEGLALQMAAARANALLHQRAQKEIAERRRAEEALRKSEAEKATVLNSMSEIVVYQDMEMRILWANKAAGETFGLSPQALRGQHCYRVWHHRDEPCEECPVLKARISGRPQQGEITTADGRHWWVRGDLARDLRGDVLGMVGVSLDITERKRAEADLQEQVHFLQQLIDAIPNPIFYTDTQGLYRGCNKAFAEHCGIPQSEIVGKSVFGWAPEELAAQYHSLDLELFSDPGIQVFESRVSDADGSQREVITNKATYSDIEGNVAGLVGVMVDITERKHLEDQLRQAQKMEAIGKLAGGIAHDFNNVLTVINGCSEILLDSLWPDDPVRHDVEEIRKAGERATRLTQQLLTFSRRQVAHTTVLNLNELLQGMAQMLHRVIGEDVSLQLALAPKLGSVRADRGQIEQVVMNLAVNAREAMPAGGVLTLETASVRLGREYAARHMGVEPGPYVMLAISDTGCGMSPEVKEHLFEPFFTTKEKSGGTGLGLSTVYGIVKQSGGTIQVYSEVGRGTTFKIYLPRVREKVGELTDPAAAGTLPRGTETVLVVEDDETVRSFAVRMLEHFGYTTLEAPSGADALVLFRERAEPVHLVLTDVVMPEMSGLDFVRRMRQMHGDFEVLFMSGYTDDAIANHGVLDPGVSFIEKPFTVEALAVKVRQLLDANGV